MHLQAMYQPCTLIEGIEGQFLNALHFLAPHYRSHIRLADAHYPVRNTLSAVLALEVVLLLAVHLRDDFQITFLPGCQQTPEFLYLPVETVIPVFNLPFICTCILFPISLGIKFNNLFKPFPVHEICGTTEL